MNKIARSTTIESILLIALNTAMAVISVMTTFKRIRLSSAWRLFISMVNSQIIKYVYSVPLIRYILY